MALFKRAGAKKQPAVETSSEQNAPEQLREPVKVTLDPGRVAEVYLQLYRWVFSVSLDFGSYQVESGSCDFVDDEIPLRGYYKDLMDKLAKYVIESQREEFLQSFSQQHLRAVIADGYNCVSDVFYFQTEKGEKDGEENGASYNWYEFRAEYIPDPDGRRTQLLLYVRLASGEKDTGRIPKEKEIPVKEDGSYDWMEIRSERLLHNDQTIYFEYDIENDKMYTHRMLGDKQIDREEMNFLKALTARADWMVYHENIRDVQTLFKNAMQGISGETEIRYRKDGMQGANFIYYKIICRPLETLGKPTWLFGSIQDIDERVREREQARDVLVQMDVMLGKFYSHMFQIDTNRGTISRIVRTDTGFQREKTPQKLDTYINTRISKGVIAPESSKEYLNWLQKGFLQRKTMKDTYEFEAKLMLQGESGYRWYSETITAVEKRPGIFMRLRRDISEAHEMREKQFEMAEKMRFAEYNSSVLDTMASLVEFRNIENGMHVTRVRELTQILLTSLAKHSPEYGLTQSKIDLYTQASTIHDIGKITIEDSILNEPGRYSPEEYEIMKKHTVNGAQIVDRLYMPGMDDLKACCRDVVLHHHERYDGKGYPDGLVGDANSIGVQVVGLADVYDALVSVRCYKDAMSFDEAHDMILSGKCGAFNPVVLESMMSVESQMRALYSNDQAISEGETIAAEALLHEQKMTVEVDNDVRHDEDQERDTSADGV